MSGSFESMRWSACVHRPDLCLYSHLKEFSGNGVCIIVHKLRCCHTEIEVADQISYLSQSQYFEAWPTSPRTDSSMAAVWHDNGLITNS